MRTGTSRTLMLTTALLMLAGLLPGQAVAGTDGSWRWPLNPVPVVVRAFEPPPDPWGAGHRGVDLAGRPGQPVLAVAAGTVAFAGQVADVDVVVVRHGDLRSTYQPVVASVRPGDPVASGMTLGTLSSRGSHCLPEACLHLGAKHGRDYVDPLGLLADQPIRLKPLDAAPAPLIMHPVDLSRATARAQTITGSAPSSGARVSLAVGGPQPF